MHRTSGRLLLAPAIAALVAAVFMFVALEARAQISQQVLKAAVTVAVGVAATEASAKATEARQVNDSDRDAIRRLQQNGLDPRNGAIFSVYFDLKNDASSIYWADIVNRPDVYLIVSIAGRGDFLIPRIQHEYGGQPILEHLFGLDIEAGRKVVVSIYDDDALVDVVWNSILSTRVNLSVNADFTTVTKGIPVGASASGSIQLLDRSMTLDAADYLGGMAFVVPDGADGRKTWEANGVLYDHENRDVGRLRFKREWKADMAAYEAALENERGSHQRVIRWTGAAIVLGLVFLKLLFSRSTVPAALPPAS